MSLSLKVIRADIKTAKNNISPIINLANDEMMYNIAAYHAQQATEKCLKIILNQHYGMSEDNKHFKIHNIAGLLGLLEDYETPDKPCPIEIPEIIYSMSAEITAWEASSRYNDNIVVLRNNIKQVLKACNKMVSQLQKANFR